MATHDAPRAPEHDTGHAEETAWLRRYALLALRVSRQGGGTLIYRGPGELSELVEAEESPPPARLVADAEELLAGVDVFESSRARFLAAHVRALRAAARLLDGTTAPLAELARECLGVDVAPVPEEVLAEAHDRLAAALPPGPGGLADRLHAWQDAHSLPPERLPERLPGLVDLAVAETRRRTAATVVPLPADEEVGCRLQPNAPFGAAGHYEGGVRSTIFVNADLPFNVANLLYVVAHEGHPGHIAESLLKERRLVAAQGRWEQQVRPLLSPPFVLSEGLGLHAEAIVFPGDEAQAWLADRGVVTDPGGFDLAAIHRAHNDLLGAWSNAAFLAAEGRPEAEVAAYLARWALLSERETPVVVGMLGSATGRLYQLAYYQGWRLLDAWLGAATTVEERNARVRRLLTEQLLPADLAAATSSAATSSAATSPAATGGA